MGTRAGPVGVGVRGRDRTIMSRAPPSQGRVQPAAGGNEAPAKRYLRENSPLSAVPAVVQAGGPMVDPRLRATAPPNGSGLRAARTSGNALSCEVALRGRRSRALHGERPGVRAGECRRHSVREPVVRQRFGPGARDDLLSRVPSERGGGPRRGLSVGRGGRRGGSVWMMVAAAVRRYAGTMPEYRRGCWCRHAGVQQLQPSSLGCGARSAEAGGERESDARRQRRRADPSPRRAAEAW
jgi:hypothetical protein